MKDPNTDGRQSRRRKFLATLGALGASSLAGCSFSFDLGGDSEPDPTPVETTRPPSPTSTATETPTQTATTTPTVTQTATETATQTATSTPTATLNPNIDPELIDPEVIPDSQLDLSNTTFQTPILDPTVVDGGDSNDSTTGTPSETSASGDDIEVAVMPGRQSVGAESLGSESRQTQNDMVCTTRRQQETADGGGLLTDNLVLNHRLNEIWPGAIIPATSVANGGFGPALSPSRLPNRQAVDVRNPISLALYIDANRYGNQNPNVSQVIDPPTSDNVEQARVELLSNVQQGTSAAQMSFDIRQVHSEKHLDTQLGVDYDSLTMNIEGDFSYSTSTTRNKLLVKLYQVYYLMGVTFPNPNGSFVTDSSVVERNDLLISDVAFGRLLLFSAESKHSVEDMKASLDATFSGVAGSGSASLSVEQKRVLDETRLKGQAIGGGATDATQLISNYGEDSLPQIQRYATDGANYGPSNPGSPIGFTARYLSTQDRANTYMTTEYNARSCYPKTREFRVHNVTLSVQNAGGDGGGNLKIYGDIGIGGSHPDQPTVIVSGSDWSRDRDEQLTIDEGTSQTLSDIDKTISFDIPEDQTWNEFMQDAEIQVMAELREKDGLSNDEYQGDTETGSWSVTDPLDRTPTIVFSEENNVVHLNFDVEPVPLN